MGTKTKLRPKPVMRIGRKSVVGEMSSGDGAEVERGEAEGEEAEGEQIARVDLVGEVADDGHAADGAEAARRDDEAGGEGGVAEQLLVEERKNGDGGVDGDAEEEDEGAADEEVAILEDLEIDERVLAPPGLVDEPDEATTKKRKAQRIQMAPNQSTSWPLSRMTWRQPVQTTSAPKPMLSKRATLALVMYGGILDEAVDHEERQHADGDVDVEGVAPGVGVGEPAAEGGAEHGGDDDAEGEDGHGGAAFARREAFEQDGLREGLEGAAAGSLDDAGEQQEAEGGRGSAGEAGDGEDGDAGHEEALAAEAQGEPVGGGKDDGVGDEVAGEHPGGFVGGWRRASRRCRGARPRRWRCRAPP